MGQCKLRLWNADLQRTHAPCPRHLHALRNVPQGDRASVKYLCLLRPLPFQFPSCNPWSLETSLNPSLFFWPSQPFLARFLDYFFLNLSPILFFTKSTQ